MKKRHILYVSSMFDYETYEKLYTLEDKPMHAANKYHTLLTRGMAENGAEVTACSALPMCRAYSKRLWIRVPPRQEGGCRYRYLPIVNIPVLRHILTLLSACFRALLAPRDTVVFYDTLIVSASLGAVLGAKLSGKKSVAIVTDLPEFMPIAQSRWMLNINERLLGAADGYVFLTEQMNTRLNPKGKPFTVIEGLVDDAMAAQTHAPFEEACKKVIYAGSLLRIYGIADLCQAFLACGAADAQLHIYGDGDYAGELRELARTHKEIVFHGNCLNREVVEAELSAALLVNPRPAQGEYTKYSFPSKTLEYMVSGTPVLTSRLAGIPEEYREHLWFFENGEEGLTQALRQALALPAEALAEFGAQARTFALEQKNNRAQARKAAQLVDRLLPED